MMTIYKYPFAIEDRFVLRMPAGTRILHVETQGGTPCLWALVDTTHHEVGWVFRIYGTGHPIAEAGDHVATFQQGPFVWHMFLVGGVAADDGGPPP